jgi:hypothetical protein
VFFLTVPLSKKKIAVIFFNENNESYCRIDPGAGMHHVSGIPGSCGMFLKHAFWPNQHFRIYFCWILPPTPSRIV